MKRIKKQRPLSDEEMSQLKIKPQWWLERQQSMNNTDNPRDTQFSGFAKAVMSELLTYFGDFEDMERIITQRAYDLVKHAVKKIDSVSLGTLTTEECIERIPDLTELSKDNP